MSSFIIALDLGRNHITASLVRIEQSSKENLSIERDTFYLRSFRETGKNEPHLLISNWIDCLDNLLQDFVEYYQEDDKIIGIACSISNSIDCQSGIDQIQSSSFNKYGTFFGLNLRLLFQAGLRDLILHWKQKEFFKYYTPPTSPRSTISYSTEQTTTVSVASSKPPKLFNISPAVIRDDETETLKLSLKRLRDYCGLQENDTDEMISNHQEKISTSKLPIITDNFYSKLPSIIEQLPDIPVSFHNKTICFALGESTNIRYENYERILVLTLGTYFGSTFIDRGEVISNRDDIPPHGMLSQCPYDECLLADECFSTRGLINIYLKMIQRTSDVFDGYSLAQQALKGDDNAMRTFQIFAHRLGEFVVPYLEAFQPTLLLIGGGLAQAWYLIETELNRTLEQFSQMEIYFNLSNEKSICHGAVQQHLTGLFQPETRILRPTHHYILPVIKTINSNSCDFYRDHELPIGYIGIGYKQLNEKLFRLIKENHILLIDGFPGIYFDQFANQLNKFYFQQTQKSKSRSLNFYNTEMFLRTQELDFKITKDLIDFTKLNYLKTNLSYPCVIIGPGASFMNETSPLVYIDLPENEVNYRIAAQTACTHSIFNKLKQELLPRMNFFIDGQRPNCPTWLDGDTFRQALAYISDQPICLRSSFIMGNPNLSQSSDSGIILSDVNQHLVEFSSNILFCSQVNEILGNDKHYRLFNESNDFPIQFQLFHTMNRENRQRQFQPLVQKLKQNKAYYIIKRNQYSTELDIEKSSECGSSDIHELFFADNEINDFLRGDEVILEISTRTHISDKFRLNINKQFDYQPISIQTKSNKYEEQQLPTPESCIYEIRRLIINANEPNEIIRYTENRFHLCMLVEGDAIEIEVHCIDNHQQEQTREYRYLETFVIPASIDQYRLRTRMKNNHTSDRLVLLIAFLKWDCAKIL